MGDLYFWAYSRKRKPWLMQAMLDQFDINELKELHEEGFVKKSWIEKYKDLKINKE